MSYFNIYNHFYQKTHTLTKRMVINEMKMAKNKSRPFLTVHNAICKYLYDYYSLKYTNQLKVSHKKSFEVFNDRHSFYQGDSDNVIKWILQDEVLVAFNKDSTSSYTKFIADLAIESSLKEAQRHYRNYKDYYELIYDLDMYENFFFKDFKGINYTSSNYHKDMVDKKHPYLRVERNDLKKVEKHKHEPSNSIHTNKDDKEQNISELLNSFSDDEKYVVINIMNSLKSDPLFKLTDFIKLVKIVGTFADNSIFIKNPKSVTSYSKASKGIDYYSQGRRLEIIESILNKMSAFKIEIISQELNKMRFKLLKEKI